MDKFAERAEYRRFLREFDREDGAAIIHGQLKTEEERG